MRVWGAPCTEGAVVAAVGAFARAVHDLGCARCTEPRLYNHLIDALLRENLAYSTCSDFEFALPDCEVSFMVQVIGMHFFVLETNCCFISILRRLHAMIPSRGSSGVSKRGS
jgi:hypothetical protein